MEKFWNNLVTKAKENKETLTRVGLTVLGALVGAVAATVVANVQNDDYLLEEITSSMEEDEE